MSLIGLALVVVIVSKQAVNVTMGAWLTDTGFEMRDAGLFVVQVAFDVNVQDTISPFAGINV